MTGGNRRLATVGLGAIAAVAGLALAWRPREIPLLQHATRICSVDQGHAHYWWLSDHELMLARAPRGNDWSLVRYDEAAKAETPLAGLTQLLVRSHGFPDSVQLSPNGKWALWTDSRNGTIVASVDGAQHYEYPPGRPSEKRWMCESLRWVELQHDDKTFTGALIHNVVNPHDVEVRPLAPSIPCLHRFVNVAGMEPTTDGHVLASLYNGSEGNVFPAGVLALVLTAHINEVGKFQLHPPLQADRGAIVFDPMSGQLAWVLRYRPSLAVFGGAGPRVGLWVTSMRGWQSHEIGSVEAAATGGVSEPVAFKWSPDGTRISFVYRGGVWAVPVE